MSAPSRADAQALDAADPLADFRTRYVPLADDVLAYFDGNSLGRPLTAIARMWADFPQSQWANRLIRGWTEGWMDLPGQVGDELGSALLGAAAGQTVLADSTTVNFYKAMRAALNLRPDRTRVVLDRANFPTDRYVVESLARDLGLEIVWITPGEFGGVTVGDLQPVLDDRVAVVTLSQIAYHSGYLSDMDAINSAVHAVGALTVWDLSHSVGVYPVELDRTEADFAVGCSYKFVGGGPGAPAFLYAAARHHGRLDQPIWGWLGRSDSFEMAQDYIPAAGVAPMLSGTPPVPAMLAVREGVRHLAAIGIDRVHAKAVALTDFALTLYDNWLAPLGFGLASPRDAAVRGAHLSVTRADARELCARLVAAGVIPDFRTPDAIRIGLSPVPASYTEVWDGLSRFAELAAG